MLCSGTLKTSSLTQVCQMGTSEFNAVGNPVMDYYPIQGGVEIYS